MLSHYGHGVWEIREKMRLTGDAFVNEERAWDHMTLHTKLTMADIWKKDVAACLITSFSGKHYLSNGLKERTFLEISEDLIMTGSLCVKFMTDLPYNS